MRYLKEYNESKPIGFTQEEVDDIRDIFQDMIDEHNMEVYDDDVIDCGVTYFISKFVDKVKCRSLMIRIFTPTVNGAAVNWNNEERILGSIDEFVERLRLMKFSVKQGEIFRPRTLWNQGDILDCIEIIITKP